MTLTDELAAYLSRTEGQAVEVRSLARIPGGASRETYRFDAVSHDKIRPLILRRDPVASLLETDREIEFLAYRTAQAHMPVPAAIALEPHGAELGRPFFIMERIDGGIVPSPFSASPFGGHARAIGEQVFRSLGRLARVDPAGTPLGNVLPKPKPEECWQVALDHWAGVLERDETYPQPIARAAVRSLRAHPPPPAQAIRIVHGDFRSGNWMHDGAGRLLAVLDWEMTHLGDPLEDLGWVFDPLWCHGDPSTVCGTVPRDQVIAWWCAESGLAVDERALAWWSLFNAVKGRAIWTTADKEYRAGQCLDPVLGISALFVAREHDAILAALLQQFVEAV